MKELIRLLNKLEEKLKEIDKNTFYGVAGDTENNLWNYIVYARNTTDISTDRNGFVDRYVVTIVRENYVPENTFDLVVEAVEQAGFKVSNKSAEYLYMRKNADTIVEICSIYFHKARRR